ILSAPPPFMVLHGNAALDVPPDALCGRHRHDTRPRRSFAERSDTVPSRRDNVRAGWILPQVAAGRRVGVKIEPISDGERRFLILAIHVARGGCAGLTPGAQVVVPRLSECDNRLFELGVDLPRPA